MSMYLSEDQIRQQFAGPRDQRAKTDCDIWSLIAPDVACPACGGSFENRLEQAAGPTDLVAAAAELEVVETDGSTAGATSVDGADDVQVLDEAGDQVIAESRHARDARDELSAFWGSA